MSAFLTKEGNPTNDVQCAGEFDQDAHMQAVNAYIDNMTDDDIDTVIRDSDSVNVDLVRMYRAYGVKNKKYQGMTADELLRLVVLDIDDELIAYAERNM